MGLFKRRFSSSSYTTPAPQGNPDPSKWEIGYHKAIGKFLVVAIRYPDCNNYEGKKILVYENVTIDELKAQGKIDPHFSEDKKYKSPFARFEPTDRGLMMAVSMCEHFEWMP